jgi:recombinational DNA repair protein (RecF pathway)
VLLHFETRLLEILGFRPDLQRCSSCRRPPGGNNGTKGEDFRLTPHGILCRRCGEGKNVRGETLTLLGRIQGMQESEESAGMRFDRVTGEEAREIVWYFLRNHADEIKRLKSETVFSALMI